LTCHRAPFSAFFVIFLSNLGSEDDSCSIRAQIGQSGIKTFYGGIKVDPLTVYRWLQIFLLRGTDTLKSKKSPGRKPALTKSQKRELDKMITDGPSECGFPGSCWRSPMIQKLIYEKFGVFYSVHYISQLLKNMGFSYQKANFSPTITTQWKDKNGWTKNGPKFIVWPGNGTF
jgi:transposase